MPRVVWVVTRTPADVRQL